MGMYFEDFVEGQVIKSGGRTLTDADLVMFAGITGNANPLHLDEEYARSLGHPGRLVHGLLTLSLLSGLIERTGIMDGTILAHLEVKETRFLKPVFVGDTLHAEARVVSKRPLSDGKRGIVTSETVGVNQRGEEVIRALNISIYKCRPAS